MARLDNSVYIADGVRLAGNIAIGKNSSVWYNSVLRTTGAIIDIGEGTNVQDGAILHASNGKDITIGDYSSVGHGAIVHCCTIGSNTLVGMGATIMTGARVGDNCIIAAGALVTGGTVVPDGMLAMGSPAKVRRSLTPEEIEENRINAMDYIESSREALEESLDSGE